MVSKNNNKLVVIACFVLTVGCTATGQIDWAKIGGTILQVAALNYTGPFVASIDTVYTAFTGQKLERPPQQDGQYYPEPGYPQQPVNQDPAPTAEQGYPQDSWEQWGDPVPGQAARGDVAEGALAIDFALLKYSDGRLTEIADGARLRDGVNRPEEGDRFGILFSTNERAFVYILNVDSTGWAQTLFPYPDVPGFTNPVDPGREILLPGEQLYGLDDARGIETVFVLVSRTPNEELEQALQPLRGMERSNSIGSRGNDARVTVPTVGQRGLVGIVPGATQTDKASLDRYFGARDTTELAFSRWFVHE